MFFKAVCLLLCAVYAARADEFVNAVPCISSNITSHSQNAIMKVSGCSSEHTHCPLYRGTNHSVEFFFEPTRHFLNKTDSRVYGVFEKFTVPYGKKVDACELSVTVDDNAPCNPQTGFVPGRVYKYTSIFAVSSSYPTIDLKVRFNFYDRRYKTSLMCLELPVKIKDPESNQV